MKKPYDTPALAITVLAAEQALAAAQLSGKGNWDLGDGDESDFDD